MTPFWHHWSAGDGSSPVACRMPAIHSDCRYAIHRGSSAGCRHPIRSVNISNVYYVCVRNAYKITMWSHTVLVSAGLRHGLWRNGPGKIVSSRSERVLKVRPTPEWNRTGKDKICHEGCIQVCSATDDFDPPASTCICHIPKNSEILGLVQKKIGSTTIWTTWDARENFDEDRLTRLDETKLLRCRRIELEVCQKIVVVRKSSNCQFLQTCGLFLHFPKKLSYD